MPYSSGNFKANPSQNTAITHPPAPLMILAGAGTGKTSTLIHRIRYLCKSDLIKPENTLLLTFTEKATAEAKQIIHEIMGEESESIFVGTFHSFCHSIMRRYGPEDRMDDVLWEDKDIIYFLINHFNEMDFIQSRVFSTDPVKAITESFIPFFSRIRDELLTPKELLIKAENIKESTDWILEEFPGIHEKNADLNDALLQIKDLVQAYDFFQKAKTKNNAMDFGDMILGCYTILKEDETVLKKVRSEFCHIFIDEYQDNNYALNLIVNLIAEKNPSITVVGDEDQCIYSFRGANYYNIADFRNRYQSHSKYAEIPLEENRRSTQAILDLANASIGNNPDRTAKQLKCLPEDKMRGPKPVWIQADRTQSLQGVPMVIHEIINEGRALYGDIAVICRGWANVRAIASAMQKAAIPVDIHIEKFFDVPIVKDVLAWGHLISHDRQAEIALYRILKQQMGEDWTRTFFRSMEKSSAEEKFQKLESRCDESADLKKFIDSIKYLKQALGQNRKADEMVWAILHMLKDWPLLKDMRNAYRYRERLNLANAGEILNLAEEFVNMNPDGQLSNWLGFMEIMSFASNQNAAQPQLEDQHLAVQVMTIHQSKGLQFPIVILPFLQSGSFPSSLKKHPTIDRLPSSWMNWEQDSNTTFRDLHNREERRVFYVGVTRAEKKLYLFGPTSRQSIFTAELESAEPQPMEIRTMNEEKENLQSLNKRKQQLLASLNREVAANQIDNARKILDEIGKVDTDQTINGSGVIPAMDEMLHLSATKIDTYSTCSLKYRLKHIDKVPERKTRATAEFGSIMHNILEEFHGMKKEEQSEEKLIQLLDKHWRKDAFEYRLRSDEFHRQGEEILSDYFQFISKNPPNVLEREKTFNYTMNQINVKISGKIDRIDQDGDKLDIVDYKTSKKKEKAEKNLQMALYTEAIMQDAVPGVRGKPGKASLYFLRHGDDPLSSYEFTENDLIQSRKKIKEVAEGIRSGHFEPDKNEFKCQYCDYKDFLCPAWEE